MPDHDDRSHLDTLCATTRTVVHELNNQMCTILSIVELIGELLPADHPLSGDLAEIQRAGQRAVATTRELDRVRRNVVGLRAA